MKSFYTLLTAITISASFLWSCNFDFKNSGIFSTEDTKVPTPPAPQEKTIKLTSIFDSPLSEEDLKLHEEAMRRIEAFRDHLYKKYENDSVKRGIVDIEVARLQNEYNGYAPERANFFFLAGAAGSGKTTLPTDIMIEKENFGFSRGVNHWSETIPSGGLPNLDEIKNIIQKLKDPPTTGGLAAYYKWLETEHRASWLFDEWSKLFEMKPFEETDDYLELLKKKPQEMNLSKEVDPNLLSAVQQRMEAWESLVEAAKLKYAENAGKIDSLKGLLWEILSANGKIGGDIQATKPDAYAKAIAEASRKLNETRILLFPLERSGVTVDDLLTKTNRQLFVDKLRSNIDDEISNMAYNRILADDPRMVAKVNMRDALVKESEELTAFFNTIKSELVPNPAATAKAYTSQKQTLLANLVQACSAFPEIYDDLYNQFAATDLKEYGAEAIANMGKKYKKNPQAYKELLHRDRSGVSSLLTFLVTYSSPEQLDSYLQRVNTVAANIRPNKLVDGSGITVYITSNFETLENSVYDEFSKITDESAKTADRYAAIFKTHLEQNPNIARDLLDTKMGFDVMNPNAPGLNPWRSRTDSGIYVFSVPTQEAYDKVTESILQMRTRNNILRWIPSSYGDLLDFTFDSSVIKDLVSINNPTTSFRGLANLVPNYSVSLERAITVELKKRNITTKTSIIITLERDSGMLVASIKESDGKLTELTRASPIRPKITSYADPILHTDVNDEFFKNRRIRSLIAQTLVASEGFYSPPGGFIVIPNIEDHTLDYVSNQWYKDRTKYDYLLTEIRLNLAPQAQETLVGKPDLFSKYGGDQAELLISQLMTELDNTSVQLHAGESAIIADGADDNVKRIARLRAIIPEHLKDNPIIVDIMTGMTPKQIRDAEVERLKLFLSDHQMLVATIQQSMGNSTPENLARHQKLEKQLVAGRIKDKKKLAAIREELEQLDEMLFSGEKFRKILTSEQSTLDPEIKALIGKGRAGIDEAEQAIPLLKRPPPLPEKPIKLSKWQRLVGFIKKVCKKAHIMH